MRPLTTKDIGSHGERVAKRFLHRLGMRCLVENWRCRAGEIDLIMLDDRELVFVEVKTRLAGAYAEQYLFSSITVKKQQRLRRLVDIYVTARYGRGAVPDHRIDLVGVQLASSDYSIVSVQHLVGVL